MPEFDGGAAVEVSWALMQSAGRRLLVLESSSGRHPIKLKGAFPLVIWERFDGGLEQLNFGAEQERLAAGAQMAEGILVAEFAGDAGGIATNPPSRIWEIPMPPKWLEKASSFGPVGGKS